MYANLDFNIGSVNPSGIGTTVYRIRKRYIQAWPTIVDDPDAEGASESGMASYAGNFSTASAKYWQKMYSTQGKGSITVKPPVKWTARCLSTTVTSPSLTSLP